MSNKREDLYLRSKEGKKLILKSYVKKNEFEEAKRKKKTFFQKLLFKLKLTHK